MRFVFLIFAVCVLAGCDKNAPVSTGGVKKADVEVQVGTTGMTIEQENIAARLKLDNMPGSIKHLYVISAYSGQVLVYSTVRGKVTSSGKRLTPSSVFVGDLSLGSEDNGFSVNFNGRDRVTSEALQDDGTYGSSIDYLYWWDAQGRYHQHYISGGQILHVSDQPLLVKGVVINMEIQ